MMAVMIAASPRYSHARQQISKMEDRALHCCCARVKQSTTEMDLFHPADTQTIEGPLLHARVFLQKEQQDVQIQDRLVKSPGLNPNVIAPQPTTRRASTPHQTPVMLVLFVQ